MDKIELFEHKDDNSFTIHCSKETYVFGNFWNTEDLRDKSKRIISFKRLSSYINESSFITISGLSEYDLNNNKEQKIAFKKLISFFQENGDKFFGTDFLLCHPCQISLLINLEDNSFNFQEFLDTKIGKNWLHNNPEYCAA